MSSQSSASTFCTSSPTGFGYLPLLTRFDPTLFIRPETKTLTSLLVPSAEDIKKAQPLLISGERPAFQSIIGETEANGVHDMTMKAFSRFNFVSNGQTQFRSHHGLGLGLVSPNSYNDSHVQENNNNLYVAELENKGAESSLLPAIAQSAASATNFCIGQLARGVPIDDCVVAVVSNTGVNICFGATILLQDSFPTYVPLSKQLDLLDDYESRVAFAFMQKIADHGKNMSGLRLMSPPPTVSQMVLSLDRYFVKRITQSVFDRGFGLFISHSSRYVVHDIQNGLNHMIRCLNRLYDSDADARHVAEYPLSVRTPDSEDDRFELV